ncbi:helix-turn-helix transcriptional regulator [Algoriphagus aquatilis]|uniref:Helix-turn-helix transcriptional regulator n=1 Tax=Algoriphagus aquatilis TaxID=490186 RepID=A0ABW0C0G4_9BACT
MELGHHLKKARESKRMSQQEVAELLGISQKTLSNIESGKSKPSIVQLSEMGKLYEVEIIPLLAENGIHLSPPPPQQIVMRSKKS